MGKGILIGDDPLIAFDLEDRLRRSFTCEVAARSAAEEVMAELSSGKYGLVIIEPYIIGEKQTAGILSVVNQTGGIMIVRSTISLDGIGAYGIDPEEMERQELYFGKPVESGRIVEKIRTLQGYSEIYIS